MGVGMRPSIATTRRFAARATRVSADPFQDQGGCRADVRREVSIFVPTCESQKSGEMTMTPARVDEIM